MVLFEVDGQYQLERQSHKRKFHETENRKNSVKKSIQKRKLRYNGHIKQKNDILTMAMEETKRTSKNQLVLRREGVDWLAGGRMHKESGLP